MTYFEKGGEKPKMKTVEDITTWLKHQINSLTEFSKLFGSYDKRKDVMDAQKTIMEQTLKRIEKEKENLNTGKDAIELIRKEVTELTNAEPLGIFQIDQMVKAKGVILENILEKMEGYIT